MIHYLVRTVGYNANLLLNVGPRPNGEFPDIAVERYHAIGNWLKQYGESIYGTRGGVISPRQWGVTTQKDNILYVHILNLQEKALFLPLTERKIKSAKVFIDKKPVKFSTVPDGVVLSFEKVPDETDYVIELELK